MSLVEKDPEWLFKHYIHEEIGK